MKKIPKKLRVNEIREKLHKLEMELHKSVGINSLTSKYRMKVSYMLMWMRFIPINKKILEGWRPMPDNRTIRQFAKEGEKLI